MCDDHADTGMMLKYLLGSSDYEVETADTIEVPLNLQRAASSIYSFWIGVFRMDRRRIVQGTAKDFT